MEAVQIVFITDPHGSNAVLSKAMDEAAQRRVDLLIVCGDLEGKYLLFVEEDGDNVYWEDPVTGVQRRGSRAALSRVLSDIADCGGYGVVVPRGWDPALQTKESLDRILAEEARSRMQDWVDRLGEFAETSGTAVQMMPGNDDAWDFDRIIRGSGVVQFVDETVCQFRGYRFGGISSVPPTPWNTPREVSEKELASRLESLVNRGDRDLPMVLIAHTPPYACGLDNAPLLDKRRKQVILGGVLQTTPVGSKSLRNFLERRNDIPLGLHGHVHESAGWARVGSTLCLNPGTEYLAGVMVGNYVQLSGGSVKHFEGVRV